MLKPYRITIVRSSRINSGILLVSRTVAQELNLMEDQNLTVYAGKCGVRLKVRLTYKSGRFLVMNPSNLERIHLPAGRKYGIQNLEGSIHIGPVIGIMAEVGEDVGRPFVGQGFFFQQLITEARGIGELCFVFGPGGINFTNKTVLGYACVNGIWSRRVFPLPDVIYPREGGYSPARMRLRNKLVSIGCQFINPPLIGKWQTNKSISQNLSLSQYLPETRVIDSFQQVERMLNKYGAVYLKPINGSQGRNIIKVTKSRHSHIYNYYFQSGGQPREGSTRGLGNLRLSLRKIMGHRRYIVQQQIDLLRVHGNISDVRVMVQKDQTGQWTVTGKAFRIGKRGSITSNISGGGSGQKLSTVLPHYFSSVQDRERIMGEINYLAIEAAKSLEKDVSRIGELGIDIGVDTAGKLWFIEANLKPARKVFVMIGEKNTRKMTVLKPLLYGRYLAGFSQER